MALTLNREIRNFIIENGGSPAKTALALEAGVSVHLIEKIINVDGYTPKPENVVKLRKALQKLLAQGGYSPGAA